MPKGIDARNTPNGHRSLAVPGDVMVVDSQYYRLSVFPTYVQPYASRLLEGARTTDEALSL